MEDRYGTSTTFLNFHYVNRFGFGFGKADHSHRAMSRRRSSGELGVGVAPS